MTGIPETHRDLLSAQVGSIATTDPSGQPQVSPVWFLADGETVRLSLNETRQKTKNILRNSEVSFLILDLENPYRYLELRDEAVADPDPEYRFAEELGAKYGADLRQHDSPGDSRFTVTITPDKVIAVDLSA